MSLLEKAKKSMEKPKKVKAEDLKPPIVEKSKEPKKKKKGISERKLNKRQTLDAIYNLSKENILNDSIFIN